jgi:hypothetical protein
MIDVTGIAGDDVDVAVHRALAGAGRLDVGNFYARKILWPGFLALQCFISGWLIQQPLPDRKNLNHIPVADNIFFLVVREDHSMAGLQCLHRFGQAVEFPFPVLR